METDSTTIALRQMTPTTASSTKNKLNDAPVRVSIGEQTRLGTTPVIFAKNKQPLPDETLADAALAQD